MFLNIIIQIRKKIQIMMEYVEIYIQENMICV